MAAAERVVIVLWSAGPDRLHLVAAPFVYALAARALEHEVEIHYTADCVHWLFEGVAGSAFTDSARTKTVADFMREAKAAGIRQYACSMALAEHRRRGEPLVELLDGQAGAASVVGALGDGARVLVF
ncbi:MAG: DsrE family protein [Betaproteobacteria bacterium]|nr:DsrE family protein [Betaproteobacteria bacterium]